MTRPNQRRRQSVSRIVGFGIVPFFAVATPLVALPAVTARFGAEAWAAIAVSTAVGAIIGTVVELGWAWNGPMRVSRSSLNARRRHIAWAISSRSLLFAPAVLFSGIIAALLSPTFPLESVLVAIAACSTGLNMSWVLVGQGRPWLIVGLDALPRLVCVTAAALVIGGGGPLWIYPLVGLLLPNLSAPIAIIAVYRVHIVDFSGQTLNRVFIVIRAQLHVTLARLASNGYMQLPVIIVSGVSTVSQVATFASGDRLARMTLSGLAPIPSIFQQWVGAVPTRSARMTRAWRAVLFNAGVGVAAGSLFTALAPYAARVVFSGTVALDFAASSILGAMLAVVVTSRAVGGLVLVAANQNTGLLGSAVIGALVGIPLVLVLAMQYGALGAFSGVLISEVVVLLVQLLALRNDTRRDRAPSRA